jgi:hypothetical protein
MIETTHLRGFYGFEKGHQLASPPLLRVGGGAAATIAVDFHFPISLFSLPARPGFPFPASVFVGWAAVPLEHRSSIISWALLGRLPAAISDVQIRADKIAQQPT